MHTYLDSLRGAVSQRLELARFAEFWGKEPWTCITNESYNVQGEVAISVIITLYDYAAYIRQCLDSVRNSEPLEILNRLEVIVLNDCSTDNSSDIVCSYLNEYPDLPICLVNKHFNTGLADARNLGLKLARAPYLFILDADNWIHPNCLSRLHQSLQSSDASAAYGMIRRFMHGTGESVDVVSSKPWDVHELVRAPYIDAMAMFDRQSLLSVGGYSTELIHHGWFGWEDYDLWLKFANSGFFCEFVPEVLSEYRVHANSMINTTNLYAAELAKYFQKKFSALVEKYRVYDDLLLGQLLKPEITLEEQQAEKIQNLQQEILRLEVQLEQLQDQSEQLQAQLQQAQLLAQERLEIVHHLQHQLREVQTKAEYQRHQFRKRIQETELELQFREQELQFVSAGRDQYLGRLKAIESSKFWQLRTQWLLLKNQLLGGRESPFWQPEIPYPHPVRPEPLKDIPLPKNLTLLAKSPYERWQMQYEPRTADYQRISEMIKLLAYQPLISIVVPVYNTPETYLREAIDSVMGQVYSNWELCLADDASTEPYIRTILEEYAKKDRRIKVVFREENGHISKTSNSALELATGEFVALLDHDDVLRPEALYEVVFLLNRHPEADMIYSDEDKIDEVGNRRDPFFKPDWSPDSFLTRMYTCHLGVYRRSIINEIGGFRAGYEGSQDYDFVLRFTEKTDRIFHIPKILYHWRIHQQSAASGTEAKPYAYEAAKKALSDALERRGEPGSVKDAAYLGHYNIRYEIHGSPKVSIIIPTRDLGKILNQCLESIFNKSTYPNYEVILIDNGSTEEETKDVISYWLKQESARFYCHRLDIPFNFSKLNNHGASHASGEFLLFLNNDTEVITPDWIEAMLEQAQRKSIGAVGAFLLYPDDTIQHAGVVVGLGALAGHVFNATPSDSPGYFGQLLTINNYSAVTAACLMCRREVFEAVNGFNEDLAVALNDIDLCLKIMEKGYRNLTTPNAKLYHHESKSRGYEDSPEKQARFQAECDYMKQRWSEIYQNDPYYNPNLSRQHGDYRIREE